MMVIKSRVIACDYIVSTYIKEWVWWSSICGTVCVIFCGEVEWLNVPMIVNVMGWMWWSACVHDPSNQNMMILPKVFYHCCSLLLIVWYNQASSWLCPWNKCPWNRCPRKRQTYRSTANKNIIRKHLIFNLAENWFSASDWFQYNTKVFDREQEMKSSSSSPLNFKTSICSMLS